MTAPSNRRWIVAVLVAGTLPLLLLADILRAWASGWHSTNSTADVLAIGSALVLALLAFAAARSAGRAWLGRMAPRWMALVISLGLSWLGAEWVAGRVFGGELLFHRHAPGTDTVFRPTPDCFPGVHGEARYTANSLGIRGPEFAATDRYRVLCVGGSTTACLFLDDSETWPHLVAEQCQAEYDGHLWIGDVGVSGYGSWHHVEFLDSEDLLSQVQCVVFLVGINDYMRALQGRSIETPAGAGPWFERSNLYALGHNWHAARKQAKRHAEEFSDGRNYMRRRVLRQQCEIADPGPDIARGLAEFRANLVTIVQRCHQLGLRVVFLTQPVLWRHDLPESEARLLWLGMLDDSRRLSPGVLADGMAKFNQVTLEVCAELQVEAVDLADLNGDPALFYDDCHFTEAGSQRVAEALAAHLKRHRR